MNAFNIRAVYRLWITRRALLVLFLAVSIAVNRRIIENVTGRIFRRCHQGGSQYRKRRTAGVSAQGRGIFKGESHRTVSYRGRAISKHCRIGRGEGYWPQHCCAEQRADFGESGETLGAG